MREINPGPAEMRRRIISERFAHQSSCLSKRSLRFLARANQIFDLGGKCERIDPHFGGAGFGGDRTKRRERKLRLTRAVQACGIGDYDRRGIGERRVDFLGALFEHGFHDSLPGYLALAPQLSR